MDWLSIILTIVGLSLFEIITSVDNAIINAEVLTKMSAKARRWFITWGIIIAVFLVRGLLPTLIIWLSNPKLGILKSFSAIFSSNQDIINTIEASSHVLFVAGGTFLIFLFFHWLFMEPKHYGIKGEEFIHQQSVWFYAVISIILAGIVWFSIKQDPLMAFGAVIGSTAFFITHGFKQSAEEIEKEMIEGKTAMSDISKILYLEVIDATFSIDGVLGAFAFTLSIPLILIGNGIGAMVVRQLTVKHANKVKKYKYLKNGAMYSILILGVIMVLDSFGFHIPTWLSPVMTFAIVGFFFYKSVKSKA